MAEWKYVKIGDVCTVERGGSPRPIDKFITEDENGVNWIKIGDTTDSMYITKTAQKIIPEGMKKSRYVQPGDLLLSNSMSFGRPYIMKIDGCIHDGWLVLRDENNLFDKRFLYYYLSAPSTYQKLKNMAVGGVVNNLNSKMVREVSVPLPSMNEQLKIISVLSSVENLIISRNKQLNKLDELVKSRFVEMFGRVCDNKYSYEVKSLQDVCEKIKDGTHQTPKYTDDTVSGYKFLSSKDVTTGRINWEHIKYIPEELHNELYAKIAPRRGDILLAKNGTTGIAAIVDTDEVFDIYVSLALLRPVDLNSVYLWAAINSYETKQQFDASLKGVGVPNLHLGEIKKTRILVPPLDLQNQFADFVAQVDKSKLAVQKSLEQLEILKKSLMQAYFG